MGSSSKVMTEEKKIGNIILLSFLLLQNLIVLFSSMSIQTCPLFPGLFLSCNLSFYFICASSVLSHLCAVSKSRFAVHLCFHLFTDLFCIPEHTASSAECDLLFSHVHTHAHPSLAGPKTSQGGRSNSAPLTWWCASLIFPTLQCSLPLHIPLPPFPFSFPYPYSGGSWKSSRHK